MADTAELVVVPTKKAKNSRKALKQKNPSTSEANVLAQRLSEPSPTAVPPPSAVDGPEKENHGSLSKPKKSKSRSKVSLKAKPAESAVGQQQSYEKELHEMQDMLQKLRLEKERTEELLKEKDDILKQREEELENKGREKEKLQAELKKLQKLKEFKPNLTIPNLKQKEQDKKEKKKACPEKKRPNPPYVLWLKDQWNEAKKENPDAEFKDISNMLGAKWKQISAEEKKPYEEKYQAEKDAYLQVVAKEKRETEAMNLLEEEQKQKTALELLNQYLQFKQEAEKDNCKKAKKEKDPLKPKQPMSAFFLFSNERRADLLVEKKTVLEAAKIAGEEWKNMTDENKAPYEENAKKNRERYMEEMELYKQKKNEEAENLKKEEEEQMRLQKHEAFRLLKKKEKTDDIIKKTKEQKKKQKEGKNSDPNKPKKPATSFFLFSKEARTRLVEERPGIDNSTVTTLISLKWKELSDEERQVWNSKAAEGMEAYRKKMEEYNKSVASMDQKA